MHIRVGRTGKSDVLRAAQCVVQPPTFRRPLLPAQQGVSLLEVLIAVLVLAIGVLGAAALQLNAMRFNASAAHTTQASFIAYDMLDRMRANAANLASYATTVESCPATSLAPGSIGATDLADFARAVGCQLPNGSGSIAINGGRATVTIRWSEARIQAEEPDREFVVSSLIRNLAP